MIYPVCPTCGQKLAQFQKKFEDGYDKICSESHSEKEKEEMKEKLVNSFGLRRGCCKMRLMCYQRPIKILTPDKVSENSKN